MIEDTALARAVVSLEGLSVGDAYGNHHASNPRKWTTPIWEFSDDTLMTLSIYSNLRQFGRINQDELAKSFATRRDGQRGYGQGVTRLLKRIQNGDDWKQVVLEMFDGKGSYGNGAAMRVAPLGAYFADDLSLLVEQAAKSAIVTHAHPEGIAGSVAVALAAAVAYQTRGQPDPNPQEFLNQVVSLTQESEVQAKLHEAAMLPEDTSFERAAEVLGNGRPSIAQRTVPFTLWAAAYSLTDYHSAISRTAAVKGDVDTNCAIVGGIVVMYTGVEAIPSEWRTRREPLPTWPFDE